MRFYAKPSNKRFIIPLQKYCYYYFGGASIFLAAYKSGTETRGRGHWDACVGTWDWGRVTRDLGTSSMGRGDVWDGDAGR